jgi:ABC-type dipeptide/oligopeptide/nickel transport system permease subunit
VSLLAIFAGPIGNVAPGALGELAAGARTALLLTLVVLVAMLLSLGAMIVAATARSRTAASLLSRLIELHAALPLLVLVPILTVLLQAPLVAFALALSVGRAIETARLIRGELLRAQAEPFVLALSASAVRRLYATARHLLPRARGPLLASAALSAAAVVNADAALAYLGLGLPAEVPSWGRMLAASGLGRALAAAAIVLTTAALALLSARAPLWVLGLARSGARSRLAAAPERSR